MRKLRRCNPIDPGISPDFPAEARRMERRLLKKDAERLELVLERGFAKSLKDQDRFMIFKIDLISTKTELMDFLTRNLRGARLHELELYHPYLFSALTAAQRKGLVSISGAGCYPTSQCIDFYH